MIMTTALFIVSCFTLCTLSVLILENSRIDGKKKKIFISTYAVIVLAGFAEWGAVALNGAGEEYFTLHAVIKSLDYVLTPTAGVFFVLQICDELPLKKYIYTLVSANAILHLVSIFTGWTFYIDSANYYHHGPLYGVYIALFSFIIVYVMARFVIYGRRFPRRNRGSIGLIGLFVFLGVLAQTVSSEIRVVTLSLSICSVLLFIHYIEFVLQKNDMDLSEKENLLSHDIMTQCRSRYAFTKDSLEYRSADGLPQKFCIVSLDLNGLKTANDSFGHIAGDELICASARIIRSCFEPYGRCYRTGGDEFICILSIDRPQLVEQLYLLDSHCRNWHGNFSDKLSISAGYCISGEYPELSFDELVRESDKMMYRVKSEYYRQTGHDRRSSTK